MSTGEQQQIPTASLPGLSQDDRADEAAARWAAQAQRPEAMLVHKSPASHLGAHVFVAIDPVVR